MTSPAFFERDGVIAVGAPRNPFARGLHGAGALDYAFVAPLTAESLLERLRDLGGQGQILGVEGSGKTTLLRSLARHLRRGGGEALELRCDRHADIEARLRAAFARAADGASRLACLDEADALLPARRRSLCRVAEQVGVSLVLASHRDLRLPTLLRCQVNEALALQLASELLRRTPRAPALVAAHEIVAALRLRGGNLRDALMLMYDWYEERWAERGRSSWGR